VWRMVSSKRGSSSVIEVCCSARAARVTLTRLGFERSVGSVSGDFDASGVPMERPWGRPSGIIQPGIKGSELSRTLSPPALRAAARPSR
jgi:hypothetical protein